MSDSQSFFSSPTIYVDLQRALCFFLNKALLELYPGANIEDSLAGNFGFYTKVHFDSPLSTGFEKELERAIFSQMKSEFYLEPIEMERRSAVAYFKEQKQKGAVRFISEQQETLLPCIRQGSFVDPWSARGEGKDSFELKKEHFPRGISFNLFEPISEGSKAFCIEGLGAFDKGSLKELVRLKKEYPKNRHEAKGESYFYFEKEASSISHPKSGGYKQACQKKPGQGFYLRALTQKGAELYSDVMRAIKDIAEHRGFTQWQICGRFQEGEHGKVESFINEQLEASLGEFKFSFDASGDQKTLKSFISRGHLEGAFSNRGLLTTSFGTQFFLEGAIEKASLQQGIISSLQLIESILKMGGIENRKNLTSSSRELRRDLKKSLGYLDDFQKSDHGDESRFFSLYFEAVDSQGGLWPVAWIEAKPLGKRSKHWKIGSGLSIDRIIALQLETDSLGALSSWTEKLN